MANGRRRRPDPGPPPDEVPELDEPTDEGEDLNGPGPMPRRARLAPAVVARVRALFVSPPERPDGPRWAQGPEDPRSGRREAFLAESRDAADQWDDTKWGAP